MRPLRGPEELDLFCSLEYTLNHELAEDLASGRRRPEWMWLALRQGRPVARVAWWGHPDDAEPAVLDILDISGDDDATEVGAALLRTALGSVVPAGTAPPDYVRFIPPDWRDHASSRRVVESRMKSPAGMGPGCSSSASVSSGAPARRSPRPAAACGFAPWARTAS